MLYPDTRVDVAWVRSTTRALRVFPFLRHCRVRVTTRDLHAWIFSPPIPRNSCGPSWLRGCRVDSVVRWQANTTDTIVKDDKKVNVYSRLKFMDTMNLMRTSLEELVENLGKYFQGEELDLMLRKRIYTYEYMTGVGDFARKAYRPRRSLHPCWVRE